MKYVSLDIETTCLSPRQPSNIMAVSFVVEDTEVDIPLLDLPHFTCLVDQGLFSGSAFALSLNSWILNDIANQKAKNPKYQVLSAIEWPFQALHFLDQHFSSYKKITFAGKNLGIFDIQFMPQSIKDRINARIIDPGPMFLDWSKEKPVPSLGEIKDSLGFGDDVSHDPREDALDVIRVLRTTYKK